MDKEPINGIPEEDETAAEQQEITVGESTEESAESPETQAEPVPETDGAEAEEAEESPEPEETDESELCTICGESRKAEDSDYCSECEAAMLKRKIPFIQIPCEFISIYRTIKT